jgi:hypothetical protein
MQKDIESARGAKEKGLRLQGQKDEGRENKKEIE